MKLAPLSSFLTKDAILLDVDAKTKEDVISKLAQTLSKLSKDSAKPSLIKDALLKREGNYTTAIGYSCAIPHAAINGLESVVMCLITTKEGVEFGASDGIPVKLFFSFVVPACETASQPWIVKQVFKLLMEPDIRARIMQAQSLDDVQRIVGEWEKEDH